MSASTASNPRPEQLPADLAQAWRALHLNTTEPLTPQDAVAVAAALHEVCDAECSELGAPGERTARLLHVVTAGALGDLAPDPHPDWQEQIPPDDPGRVVDEIARAANQWAAYDDELILATNAVGSAYDAYGEGEGSWREITQAETRLEVTRRTVERLRHHMGETALALLVWMVNHGFVSPVVVSTLPNAA